MTGVLAQIFRHPIKGIGSEAIEHAQVSPDGAMAGDRAFAFLNAKGEDTSDWQPRDNFLQVASGPGLAAVRAATLPDGRIALSAPGRPDLTIGGEADGAALAEWVAPLWPENRPGPTRLLTAPGHGMTDMPDPYISLASLASLRALSAAAGLADGEMMDPRRFRINFWIEDMPAWSEFDLVGRRFQLGGVMFEVAQRIGRCRAPEANPMDGKRDVNVLRLLSDSWGHTDLGIYARPLDAGEIALGAPLAVA